MGEKREIIPRQYDLDAKWDASLDLTVRRFVYSSFAGAFAGLLLFSQFLLFPFLFFSTPLPSIPILSNVIYDYILLFKHPYPIYSQN